MSSLRDQTAEQLGTDIAHRTPFDVLITTPAPRPEDYT